MYPEFEDAENVNRQKDMSIIDVIDDRLRDHAIKHPQFEDLSFWPTKLFDHLFQEKDVAYVVRDLVQHKHLDKAPGQQYWIDVICGRGSDRLVYRRILAILLLAGKLERIDKFISARVADNKLPVDAASLQRVGVHRRDLDLIRQYQRRLSVPLFKPPQPASQLGDSQICHVGLTESDTQPWDYLDTKQMDTSGQLSVNPTAEPHFASGAMNLGGGFGEVHRIIIHPWQHEFHDILKLVRLSNVFLCVISWQEPLREQEPLIDSGLDAVVIQQERFRFKATVHGRPQ